MISLTPEQRAAIDHPGNVSLSACPGSGKTRVIIAKLLTLSERLTDSPRSIACITYTNAAVDEIEGRLKEFGTAAILDRVEVSTIHSFCLQFILRPYRWLAPTIPRSFRILTRDLSDFERIVKIVEDELRRQIRPQTFEDYASICVGVDGNPAGAGLERGIVTRESALRFWEIMLSEGFIDFSMILYHSGCILRDHAYVAHGLSSRFSYFLVDEFQDTNEIQIDILRCIYEQNLSGFFLVGDENQSIYRFAGARPDKASEFSDAIGAARGFSLSGNFRCGPKIVDLAERLLPRNPRMRSEGNARFHLEPPLYAHVAKALDAITEHFLPLLADRRISLGEAAILAPWWQHLVPVAVRLREMGVPVFGPGARPYQRRRLFAVLAEQLGALVDTGNLIGLPGVEKAIFTITLEVLGVSRFDIFSYSGRRTALLLVYEAKKVAETGVGGMRWLEICADICANILVEEGWCPDRIRQLLPASVQDMRRDMERRNVDVENLEISDLGLFANPQHALKLITLHNAKGREFDATALICMNEGKIPHFTARTQTEFDEARRLFYVGATRARKILFISSEQPDHRDRPTRYLSECGLR